MRGSLIEVSDRLFRCFGAQGWWPISSMAGEAGFDERGYHKGDYSYPKTDAQRFEVITGAILTQNTSWRNVERAMENLRSKGILNPIGVLRSEDKILEECLRPVGYFRVKTRRLRALVEFLEAHGGMGDLFTMQKDELRTLLLDVNGVGEETADSILLYAAGKPSFVVDAYTRRTLSRMGILKGNPPYRAIKKLFEGSLVEDVELYNEYHALLVVHAKTFCKRTPRCYDCPLEAICEKNL
ncbi:MAG: endonuclease III domain-containing protein [Candidatus Hydrothermarchaeaceae archaeon]